MAEKYEFGRRFYLLWKKRPNITPTILIISFLLTFNRLNFVNAEGNVGCHFVKTLCINRIEYCFDDLVFGICRPIAGTDNNEDYEKKPLTERQSQILGSMLEEMQGIGLGWDHPFVQCKIQGTLFSMRKKVPIPPTLCSNLAPNNSPPLRHFTPPEDTIIDEYFYPVPFKKNLNRHPPVEYPRRQPVDSADELTKMFYYPNRKFDDDMYYKLSQAAEPPTEYENEMESRIEDIKNRIELGKMMAEYEQSRNRANDIPEYEDVGVLPSEYYGFNNFKRSEPTQPNDEDRLPRTYFREIAINEHIPQQHHLQRNQMTVDMPSEIIRPADINEMEADEEANIFETNIFPNRKHHKKSENGLFTEGGVLRISDKNEPKGDTQRILAEMLGFTRRERLDVKKPGPVIGPPPPPVPKAETKEVLPPNFKETANEGEIQVISAPQQAEEDNHAPHVVDTEFAYVKTKNRIDNWKDGNKLVNELAKILHMENAFSHVRIDSHEVSWKVIPAINATDVAKAISDSRVKNNIVRRLGITIEETGIGDKVKLRIENQPQVDLINSGPDVGHIMFYMFAGAAVAATLVISVTWFLIRRHDKKRDKLGGLKSGNDQACSSDDYQDLCRARMSGKGNTSVEPVQSGRITSLTKENDRPPSSRSSTSSWSEEPVISNMDISTGHMVLSYMEDHLKNKGRLQREWEALCRYEAEPSARDAAMQSQCAPLNRPGAPLPYDHSRVVLNHLANAEGLDYINASTITDHDPRAPAYVAAQGPMSTTLSHFWQMIWEQGAVVIVTLGKLQENGEIACVRYWPEEGAEVYHIYEVHLVSEHIWCDDYLVRSFYLKNLRTSETRTVTQFHFLSWPQNGVPSSAKALLEFRRKVNKSYRGRSCPIVVHGSTGAGRTGAYILLDLVLGRMNKGAREIDIAATLEHLRDQRAGLVANRQQFEFVLMAVAEEVHAILKNLPANQSTEKKELDKETLKEENGGEPNKKSDKSTQDKKSDNDNGKSDKKSEN